jgi:hypothetical protein
VQKEKNQKRRNRKEVEGEAEEKEKQNYVCSHSCSVSQSGLAGAMVYESSACGSVFSMGIKIAETLKFPPVESLDKVSDLEVTFLKKISQKE